MRGGRRGGGDTPEGGGGTILNVVLDIGMSPLGMSLVSGTGSGRAQGRSRNLSNPLHKYGNVFVRASPCHGAAGGSYERPMERGRICVERNGSERSEVASVAN